MDPGVGPEVGPEVGVPRGAPKVDPGTGPVVVPGSDLGAVPGTDLGLIWRGSRNQNFLPPQGGSIDIRIQQQKTSVLGGCDRLHARDPGVHPGTNPGKQTWAGSRGRTSPPPPR